jgi:mannose-6-phosphate isomerase
LANTYPDDPGVVTSLLLNFVRLSPGEAMFLPAGNLHAYLSGLGIELMANSDNVLRGGLTAKHVDVDELVRVLSFGSYTPQIETGTTFGTDQASRTTFSATCPQFQLEFLQLAGGRMGIEGPLIGVVLEGELIFEVESMPHVLRRGEQFFVPCGPGLKVGGAGRCAVAFVPDV